LCEAFGRGDLPAILGMLADDVQLDADWSDNQAQRAGVEHMTNAMNWGWAARCPVRSSRISASA
jgi:hypothetical protein